MSGSSDETDIVLPGPDASSAGGSDTTDTAADTGRTIDGGPDQGGAELSVADQATVEALHTGSALLLVQHGPNAGARFLLDADVVTVGRHPGNDIFLDDVTVSRKHAQFLRGPDGFAVRDVGSLNGTYVRRRRVEGETALRTGDEVQVGKFRFLFHESTSHPSTSHPSTSPQAPAAEGGGGS